MQGEITVKRYAQQYRNEWNEFAKKAKNPLFMFDRGYMEYHSDRFTDHSLIFYSGNKPVALLPANEEGDALHSHGGLTYGGLVLNDAAGQHTVNDCFECMIQYARGKDVRKIVYKPTPHIYHEQPAEEERYALYRCHAKLMEISASTVINLKHPIRMRKGRKSQISRAKREGVEVRELTQRKDYDAFIRLENEILESRHNTHSVHSADELYLLYSRFPTNIHLYGAILSGKLIAGIIAYEYGQAIHTQYMAADATARAIGGLDYIIAAMINYYKASKLWLDFGISTENGGRYLNDGLIFQKEGFGGRTNVYEKWEIEVG